MDHGEILYCVCICTDTGTNPNIRYVCFTGKCNGTIIDVPSQFQLDIPIDVEIEMTREFIIIHVQYFSNVVAYTWALY